MITITIVRHGQSVDNTRHVWAGHRNAPLSNDGMKQAVALGKSLQATKFDTIIHSDLLRAHWTADQIYSYQSEPKPTMIKDEQLREQYFGEGEGKSWQIGGGFEQIKSRTKKFPGGENSEDVRVRANNVIAQYIEPLLKEFHGKPASSKHIALVAHGIFNSETLGTLLARLDGKRQVGWHYSGMGNTGWTKLEVGYADEESKSSPVILETNPQEALDPSSGAEAPPLTAPVDESLPKLNVIIKRSNVIEHVTDLKLDNNSIGHAAFDPKQQDLRSFFGGTSKV